MVVIDSIVFLINLIPDFKNHAKLFKFALSTINDLLSKLTKDHQSLFRKKADYVSLISQLIIHFGDRDMQKELLKILLVFWKDPDSDVREISINMVQVIEH